jgi:hypothetical protein
MDSLQTRLEALEQHTSTVIRQLRWWRGLTCTLVGLGLLSWALPSGTAQGTLEPRVAALEAKLVRLTFEAATNTLVLTGANLQIVNGLDSTDCLRDDGVFIPNCPNGVGNLIVGYNEPRPAGGENIRSGSHNVVVGAAHNFSRFGGLVVGLSNTISGNYAAISGGFDNTASGPYAVVSGGSSNTASDYRAVVSGGFDNTANGHHAVVSGGERNTANSYYTVVSGGYSNTASGRHAAVSGGGLNTASGEGAAVSGGAGNTAEGYSAVVSGGAGNKARGAVAAVSGGHVRIAPGDDDWVAGSLFQDY